MRNFAAIKAKARRDIHDRMSVAAQHLAHSTGVLTDISVRWHNKLALLGDLQDNGYASVIEGIDRVIFLRSELTTLGIVPQIGDTVIMTAEGYDNVRLTLQVKEKVAGPVEEIWQVTRL
jgi:hypothetical protein